MKNFINKAKNLFKKALNYYPTALPQGMLEFDDWANDILDTYALPNNDSTKFMLATMILHLGNTDAYKPKRYFGLASLKAASNQIASGVMQDLKQKQADRAKSLAEEVAQELKESKTVGQA